MKAYNNNRKVKHEYEIIKKFTAGVSLIGAEVKSIRNSRISLKEAYIKIKDSQAFLVQAHITKPDYLDGFTKFDETRARRLLLTKNELSELQKAVTQDGLTVMPLSIYQPDGGKKIKMDIAICKGKKLYDKRETLKRKTQEMDAKREMKDY